MSPASRWFGEAEQASVLTLLCKIQMYKQITATYHKGSEGKSELFLITNKNRS